LRGRARGEAVPIVDGAPGDLILDAAEQRWFETCMMAISDWFNQPS
jgi:hypothetical protein